MTAAVDDPVRADVERRLRSVVDGALSVPRAARRSVDACVRRRFETARQLVGTPLALLRSLFDLVATPAEPTVPRDPIETDVATPSVVDVPSDADDDAAAADAAADHLPIEEYESLAASQVVARLDGLSPSELRQVRQFEAVHRGRRTVLGKVDQLLDA